MRGLRIRDPRLQPERRAVPRHVAVTDLRGAYRVVRHLVPGFSGGLARAASSNDDGADRRSEDRDPCAPAAHLALPGRYLVFRAGLSNFVLICSSSSSLLWPVSPLSMPAPEFAHCKIQLKSR